MFLVVVTHWNKINDFGLVIINYKIILHFFFFFFSLIWDLYLKRKIIFHTQNTVMTNDK